MGLLEETAAAISADLPESLEKLLTVAEMAVEALEEAAMVADAEGVERASELYRAVIWKLNGGTFIGCAADESAPAIMVERHCQAAPGDTPKWGQTGEFLIEAGGIRALVQYGSSLTLPAHFAFIVVDLDAPFISPTGYRSHFDRIRFGQTVKEAAIAIFEGYIEQKPVTLVEAQIRNRLALETLPSWMGGITPPPRRVPATPPRGFELVDVILPSHKAFVARKWAEQAVRKMAKQCTKSH